MSSAAQDLLSAGKDGVDAATITIRSRLTTWWSGGFTGPPADVPRSTIQLLLDPQLPPLLSPLPSLFRLIAFLVVAPVIFICLVDFAGYAVFRTLGFHRRRVRVKRKGPPPQVSVTSVPAPTSSTATGAPVLTPGTYDADTLLRHRERSASAASAEAMQEWTRTGGTFARVSNVRASKEAAAASAATTTSTFNSSMTSTLPVPETDLISPPESPRNAFGRARGVGVEGALGYFDTDAEDSGAESGRSSPEVGRRSPRKGLGGGALGFTPVSADGRGAQKSLGLHVPLPTSGAAHSTDSFDRSPKSNDSVTSSWIRLEESSSNEEGEEAAAAAQAAAAADLEPRSLLA